MKKVKCAVLGSGNIGTDLLYKLKRSEVLEVVWFVGIDPTSTGLRHARDLGVKVTDRGLDGLLPNIEADDIKIAFDATSAYAHAENSRKLNALGVMMIDLTPAAIGPMTVPALERNIHPSVVGMNINMISCAGQATIPIISAVAQTQSVVYSEIVASLAAKSVGPGTRSNLDEFTHTTSNAIVTVGGAEKGKAIVIPNPAEPPILMRNTIYCQTNDAPNEVAISRAVRTMIETVQSYVPGYRLVNGPIFEDRRIAVFLEIKGMGDYLPKYAGNLDIMTAAATRTAEDIARTVLNGDFQLKPTEVVQ